MSRSQPWDSVETFDVSRIRFAGLAPALDADFDCRSQAVSRVEHECGNGHSVDEETKT
jgi:hypothetical protein